MPKRIQLSRKAGWRMPENTVKVDRSTKWGNPFKPGDPGITDREASIRAYEAAVKKGELPKHDPKELKGKNLACWCSLDGPCHADVLLKLANK